jgi:plastocyanin
LGSIVTAQLTAMRAFVLAALLVTALATAAFADDPVVTITLKDHQFEPSEVPVPAGSKVKLQVSNEQSTTAEFESRVLHFEKIVTAGGQITVFVGPLNPGSYEFYDDFHSATRGHLIVK